MSRKFVDLAICQHDNDTRKFLFQVSCYEISVGDRVIVETKNGNKYATVIAKHTVYNEPDKDEEYRFIVEAMSATLPLKRVLTKVREIDIDWSDYETEETKEEENEEDV